MGNNYGVISLLPVFLTIFLAIKYKKINMALLAGTVLGVLILHKGNPYTTIISFFADYMIPTIADSWNVKMLLLMFFITAWVKLLEASGGTYAFANSMASKINTKVKAELAAWVVGLLIFFSDIGSALMTGTILRPIFDRLNVSREKLAWIADTTASPWSIMVPFLGWAAYIMGLMAKELPNREMFPLLMKSHLFNYYAAFSILFGIVVILSRRDFKIMAEADERAKNGIIHPKDLDVSGVKELELNDITKKNANIWVMVIPVLVFIGTLFVFQPLGFPFAKGSASGIELTLILSSVLAAICSIALMKFYKIANLSEGVGIFYQGIKDSMDIILLLVFAWMVGGTTKALGAPNFIISLIKGNVPLYLIPTMIFIAGMLISFSTGSSWGTFAIMMPFSIPLALEVDSNMLPIAIGAVLSGGLFGDHCSPISDTTILAASGAGCHLWAHVRTQMPYAMYVAFFSIVSYIIITIYRSPIILPLVFVIMSILYIFIAKPSNSK